MWMLRRLTLTLLLVTIVAAPGAQAAIADDLLDQFDREHVPCLPVVECEQDPCDDHELDRMYCELIANLPDPIEMVLAEAWAAIRGGNAVATPL